MTVVLDAIECLPRQTGAWLTANNPVLPAGSRYLETDTKRTKTNTNLTASANWNSLAYDLVGPKGDIGLSAYQAWVGQGNSGTINDFLDSLKGDPGDPGESFLFVVGTSIPAIQNANTLYGRK
jgi:hypothetical protein